MYFQNVAIAMWAQSLKKQFEIGLAILYKQKQFYWLSMASSLEMCIKFGLENWIAWINNQNWLENDQ